MHHELKISNEKMYPTKKGNAHGISRRRNYELR